MRPWSSIPIAESHESLVALPVDLLRLEPHPYARLGAPYGAEADPFRLRSGVLDRLLQAQGILSEREPTLRLAIFDAWRPIDVQAFMVEHTIDALCLERGIRRDDPSQAAAVDVVMQDVARFWAAPSRHPATPPPHSTGAAVDLTLATVQGGQPLEMGSPIDAIGSVSEPDHFALAEEVPERLFHQRRTLLREVMVAAGFAQHPNEWWHYSYGDQLWAWSSGVSTARYAEAPIKSATA